MASRLPVDAPDGTMARPNDPESSHTSTSTVGLPRESRISRAWSVRMSDIRRGSRRSGVGSRTSGAALDDEAAEGADGLGGRAERRQRALGLLDERGGPGPGGREAVH